MSQTCASVLVVGWKMKLFPSSWAASPQPIRWSSLRNGSAGVGADTPDPEPAHEQTLTGPFSAAPLLTD